MSLFEVISLACQNRPMSLAEAVPTNAVVSKAPMSRNLFRAVREVECGEVLIISPFDLRGVGCVGIFLTAGHSQPRLQFRREEAMEVASFGSVVLRENQLSRTDPIH
ncbi:hypothetical protein [Xanthomonas citri]|uniref:hypothetical protein n=1 Tax=Xanthomonas citri TaxID=346 RepID=UPI00103ADD4A|nr:hypothetical protein [Xanthomonas citri]